MRAGRGWADTARETEGESAMNVESAGSPRATSQDVEPPIFDDRIDAGRQLGAALAAEPRERVVVVGLARGGVPVAAEVAARLGAPLDVVVVRKVGHPLQPELALGAVTASGDYYVSPMAAYESTDTLREGFRTATTEAQRMERSLRDEVRPVRLAGATCVLVDDGLATGATMRAAVRCARSLGATRVVAAVPVASRPGVAELAEEADEVVCPYQLDGFWAVGLWYRDFGQVSEGEVVALLRSARERHERPASGPAT
jgi:putative phosphoribosyl transferase